MIEGELRYRLIMVVSCPRPSGLELMVRVSRGPIAAEDSAGGAGAAGGAAWLEIIAGASAAARFVNSEPAESARPRAADLDG